MQKYHQKKNLNMINNTALVDHLFFYIFISSLDSDIVSIQIQYIKQALIRSNKPNSATFINIEQNFKMK